MRAVPDRAAVVLVGGVEVGDTEIKRILRQSDDPAERREAWEASKTVGAEVADDVRALARLRNEAARSLGHRDWFALSLATDLPDQEAWLARATGGDGPAREPEGRDERRTSPESSSARTSVVSCQLRRSSAHCCFRSPRWHPRQLCRAQSSRLASSQP